MALLCIIIIGTGMTMMAEMCRGGCGGWRLALLVCGARGSAWRWRSSSSRRLLLQGGLAAAAIANGTVNKWIRALPSCNSKHSPFRPLVYRILASSSY
jgi:hypothetical protein